MNNRVGPIVNDVIIPNKFATIGPTYGIIELITEIIPIKAQFE